ncbi:MULTISPECIES: SPOR domain-containing protein [Pseudomonas]|uniref:SPOR domain-containing protein n=1 Tax=Pseudomonas TaxID=286 RepID=UPI0018AA380F|nr:MULTISPECIES: SPOR domain-containing protein [Pseudomonas]MBF8747987.1 SPOR domain-containing protein [Pseudomonas monteilii]MCT8162344.1 SPOR domain-containing protein [Pseudomonas sp. HD6422]MCT8183580.1 SPOR domain-containing protein [Pseudomonas sp. HD6421]
MAVLDKGMKQRMVGALVLVALAVIFLPMLFTREDEMRQVQVQAPEAPAMPSLPEVKVEEVAVPEPQPVPDPVQEQPQEAPVVVDESSAQPTTPSQPITPSPQTQAQSQPQPKAQTPLPTPAAAAKPATATAPAAAATAPSKIDANGLPVSWSIQLASLSNRAGADNLQKTLRSQGYNAYIRSVGGMNRVYVGPLIERAEAERLRDVINRQQNLKGFVVRFQPERG